MFDSLALLPPDSILGLAAACRADSNPDKVDLTLGVYMDETGLCPVFEAVQQAQRDLVQEEMTKVYMPPQGDAAYLEGVQTLVLGEERRALLGDRLTAVQTPGGCARFRRGPRVSFLPPPTAPAGARVPPWPALFPLLAPLGCQSKGNATNWPETEGSNLTALLEDPEAASPGALRL